MAGEDMLLICASPDKIRRGYEGLLAAAKNGIVSEQRIKQSLERIARTKTIMEPPLPLDLDRFQISGKRNPQTQREAQLHLWRHD